MSRQDSSDCLLKVMVTLLMPPHLPTEGYVIADPPFGPRISAAFALVDNCAEVLPSRNCAFRFVTSAWSLTFKDGVPAFENSEREVPLAFLSLVTPPAELNSPRMKL